MGRSSLAAFSVAAVILASALPAQAFEIKGNKGSVLNAREIARFDQPWAMTFLPDGSMLVTTKPGKMFHVTQGGKSTQVGGMWPVAYAGQGGLGDVILHPRFRENRLVYVSFAESTDGSTAGAAVVRARFETSGGNPRLEARQVIWRQLPKTSGAGHYSHRMVFAPDGKLFITSGDRQELTPAQDLEQALGKIIRLNDDGSIPSDNSWQDRGERAKSYWSIGHRNPLGIAFDA